MRRLGKPAFNRLGIQGLPYGFGSPSSRSYLRKLLTPNPGVGYDPSSLILYHPMNESVGGVAIDYSPEGNDGAYTGVTLGQPGIGDGLTCPLFDGANDFNNIYSVPFDADFNGAEGTVLLWRQPINVGVWTDGVIRYFVHLYVDPNNEVRIIKAGAANTVFMGYRAGGVLLSATSAAEFDIGFNCYGVTWSALADEVRGFKDGAQLGATINGLGVWAGPLLASRTLIGAATIAPANVWDGYEAHVAVYSAPQPPAVMAYLGVR